MALNFLPENWNFKFNKQKKLTRCGLVGEPVIGFFRFDATGPTGISTIFFPKKTNHQTNKEPMFVVHVHHRQPWTNSFRQQKINELKFRIAAFTFPFEIASSVKTLWLLPKINLNKNRQVAINSLSTFSGKIFKKFN